MRRLAGALLVAVTACAPGEQAGPSGPETTDSAGVRIVEHPASPPSPSVTLREVLRIGEADGAPDRMFTEIVGGRLLEGGGVVLADRPSQEVRRFAGSGALLDVKGGEGEGPGEYRYIRGMGQCSDDGFTVFDLDWSMGHYGPDGDFLGQEAPVADGERRPYEMACSTAGDLAVIAWSGNPWEDGPPQGFHVATAHLRLLGPDGDERADLGERIGSERFGRPTGSGPHPAGRATRLAFQGGDLLAADGSFFGFERWSSDGRLREIVRVRRPPPDLDSLMSVYRETTLAGARDEETRRRWARDMEEMEGPAQATHLSELIAGDGWVVIRDPAVGRGGRWFAFRSDGRAVGFLPLPDGARLLDIRGDRMLVEERDALDVPRAVVYAVDGEAGTDP